KPVASRFHPEFNCEREQKNARNPDGERTEHWRPCEETRCRQPKQRSPRNTPVSVASAPTVTLAHALLTGTDSVRAGTDENVTAQPPQVFRCLEDGDRKDALRVLLRSPKARAATAFLPHRQSEEQKNRDTRRPPLQL